MQKQNKESMSKSQSTHDSIKQNQPLLNELQDQKYIIFELCRLNRILFETI